MKTLICLLLLTGLTLSAADLTGKWSGKFDITTADGENKPDSAVYEPESGWNQGYGDGRSRTKTSSGPSRTASWNRASSLSTLSWKATTATIRELARIRPGVRWRHHPGERNRNRHDGDKNVRQGGFEAGELNALY
jgi:hypothetical protein